MRRGPKTARTALVLLVMVITVCALYYHMVNKVKQQELPTEMTVVQELLLRNLDNNYPATPREVVKLYNEIMQCYYNEEYTDEELEGLVDKAFQIYDDELVANQNRSAYSQGLRLEIADYKEKDKVISSSAPAASTDVDYYNYKGRECANIRCVYTIREKTSLYAVKEIYVLRKDDSGHWKILGWEIYDDSEE